MSENLTNFTKAVSGFDAVVEQADPACWSNDSPCDGWTAVGVVDHVIAVTGRIASAAGAPDVVYDDGADPKARWGATRDALLDALNSPGALEKVGPTPFGEMSIDQLIGIATFDPLTHTWDLAQAVGVDAALDERVVAAAMATLEPMEAMMRETGRFGPKVEVSADADIVARYLAFSGRQPF
jgi:uncharacterized protein (TIGR03086 family)